MSGSVARVFPFAPAARASIDMLDEAENLLLAADLATIERAATALNTATAIYRARRNA